MAFLILPHFFVLSISRESEWQEGLEEEQDMDPETEKYTYKLVLPEDGYEWKKYGQKFIKNIGKFRYI